MRRLIAVVLSSLLVLGSTPTLVAAAKATGAVAGFAKTTAGLSVRSQVVRVRSLRTGAVVDTTMTAGDGSFNLSNLDPGDYVVEIVDPAGRTVGASTVVNVVAGRTAAVNVTAATTMDVGGQGSNNKAWIWVIVGVGGALAIWGIIKATGDDEGSPSS